MLTSVGWIKCTLISPIGDLHSQKIKNAMLKYTIDGARELIL